VHVLPVEGDRVAGMCHVPYRLTERWASPDVHVPRGRSQGRVLFSRRRKTQSPHAASGAPETTGVADTSMIRSWANVDRVSEPPRGVYRLVKGRTVVRPLLDGLRCARSRSPTTLSPD
jgi:hypothetical protein